MRPDGAGTYTRPAGWAALLILMAVLLTEGCASAERGARRGQKPPAIGLSPAIEGETSAAGGRDSAAADTGRPGSASRRLDIRMDFQVIDTLLRFLEDGEASDTDLDNWVRLQGNRELLRLGRLRGDLRVAALKEAARVATGGGVYQGPGSLGRFGVGSWDVLQRLVTSIRERQDGLARKASRALAEYLPPERQLPPLTVYFHVGGSWDGRTSDYVYINLAFFQARGLESLPGLEALLAHELFHLAQAILMGGVDDYSSRQSALFTVLLRIQQEGMARYIEYQYMKSHFPEISLDRTNFSKYGDGLRHAGEHAGVLADILEALSDGKLARVRQLSDGGFVSGGPLYAVGHSMAQTIENELGSAALADTVAEGPMAFLGAYHEALRRGKHPSILPVGLEAQVIALRDGYAGAWMEATRGRREGLRQLQKGSLEEATKTLKRVTEVDPTDAVSAYNLACAYALRQKPGRAIRWIEEAIRRGYEDYKHMMVDPDLVSLHDDPEFGELLRSRGVNFPVHGDGEPGGESLRP